MCGKFVCGWLSFYFFVTRYLGVDFCGYADRLHPVPVARYPVPGSLFAVSVVCRLLRFVCSCNQPSSRHRRRSVVVFLPVCGFFQRFHLVWSCHALVVLVVVVVVLAPTVVVVVVMVDPFGWVVGSMALWLSFGNPRVATTPLETVCERERGRHCAYSNGKCFVGGQVLYLIESVKRQHKGGQPGQALA